MRLRRESYNLPPCTLSFDEHFVDDDETFFVSSAGDVIAADIDGDGDLDLAACGTGNKHGRIAWYKNTDGQGTFLKQTITYEVPTGNNIGVAHQILAVDLDGDGDVELVAKATFVDFNDLQDPFKSKLFYFWENTDGQGTFGPPQSISSERLEGKVFAADIDGDGSMDLIHTHDMGENGKIVWFKNDGQANFVQHSVSDTNTAFGVFAADIDGDGDIDIATASHYNDTIAWYENTDGLGTFGPQKVIRTTADNTKISYNTHSGHGVSIFGADVDEDGDIDLATASENGGTIAWYENTDGQGTFGPQQVVATNATDGQSVYASDIDGDGDMDLASASFADDNIAW